VDWHLMKIRVSHPITKGRRVTVPRDSREEGAQFHAISCPFAGATVSL
jgi:hypothetical protein